MPYDNDKALNQAQQAYDNMSEPDDPITRDTEIEIACFIYDGVICRKYKLSVSETEILDVVNHCWSHYDIQFDVEVTDAIDTPLSRELVKLAERSWKNCVHYKDFINETLEKERSE